MRHGWPRQRPSMHWDSAWSGCWPRWSATVTSCGTPPSPRGHGRNGWRRWGRCRPWIGPTTWRGGWSRWVPSTPGTGKNIVPPMNGGGTPWPRIHSGRGSRQRWRGAAISGWRRSLPPWSPAATRRRRCAAGGWSISISSRSAVAASMEKVLPFPGRCAASRRCAVKWRNDCSTFSARSGSGAGCWSGGSRGWIPPAWLPTWREAARCRRWRISPCSTSSWPDWSRSGRWRIRSCWSR